MSTLKKQSVTFADKHIPGEHDIDVYRQQLENTLNRTRSILKNKGNANSSSHKSNSYSHHSKSHAPSTSQLDSKVKEISNSINSLKKYESSAKVSRDIVNASALTNCCSCDSNRDETSSCEWIKKVEKLKLKNRVLKDKLNESEGQIAALQSL